MRPKILVGPLWGTVYTTIAASPPFFGNEGRFCMCVCVCVCVCVCLCVDPFFCIYLHKMEKNYISLSFFFCGIFSCKKVCTFTIVVDVVVEATAEATAEFASSWDCSCDYAYEVFFYFQT